LITLVADFSVLPEVPATKLEVQGIGVDKFLLAILIHPLSYNVRERFIGIAPNITSLFVNSENRKTAI